MWCMYVCVFVCVCGCMCVCVCTVCTVCVCVLMCRISCLFIRKLKKLQREGIRTVSPSHVIRKF